MPGAEKSTTVFMEPLIRFRHGNWRRNAFSRCSVNISQTICVFSFASSAAYTPCCVFFEEKTDIHARLLHGYFLVSFFNYRFYEFKFVIYRVKSIQLFALLFYDEGDWPTKFQIGTPRPEKNVLASLHYSAFDSASWDLCSRLTNEYEWILKSCIQSKYYKLKEVPL